MVDEQRRTLGHLRNEAGLTQEQLAEQSGVSWITVAKLEGGGIKAGAPAAEQ